MVYFTSDLHFGHNREFLYEPRGYASIEEHDKDIIQKWNNVITDTDDVYILGDLAMKDIDYGIECLKQLYGRLHVVYGNHDSSQKIERYHSLPNVVEFCGYAMPFKFNKLSFYLSHYPTITTNYDKDDKMYNQVTCLCGHSHTKDPFADWDKGLIYHCELDAHDNMPVSIDQIIEDIKNHITFE